MSTGTCVLSVWGLSQTEGQDPVFGRYLCVRGRPWQERCTRHHRKNDGVTLPTSSRPLHVPCPRTGLSLGTLLFR